MRVNRCHWTVDMPIHPESIELNDTGTTIQRTYDSFLFVVPFESTSMNDRQLILQCKGSLRATFAPDDRLRGVHEVHEVIRSAVDLGGNRIDPSLHRSGVQSMGRPASSHKMTMMGGRLVPPSSAVIQSGSPYSFPLMLQGPKPAVHYDSRALVRIVPSSAQHAGPALPTYQRR